jgi:hypothetical protein
MCLVPDLEGLEEYWKAQTEMEGRYDPGYQGSGSEKLEERGYE